MAPRFDLAFSANRDSRRAPIGCPATQKSSFLSRGPRSSSRHPFGSGRMRSEEHTSELQSLMRISYAVFCLKKKKTKNKITQHKPHKTTTTSNTTNYINTHQTA